MIVPYIAAPTRKLPTTDTQKIESRNSRIGSTGSAACRSRRMKSTKSTALTTASPRIVPDPHAYSEPPHTVTNNTHVIVDTRSAAPR